MRLRPLLPPLFFALWALLLFHIFYFDYVEDDTFISLRYAQRLLSTGTLTWNDGEYVEGYSNLLWVLQAAFFGKLGFDLLAAAQAMGLACTLLTPLCFIWAAKRMRLPVSCAVPALLIYAISPPVAIWARAGLETPMVALLFTISAILAEPLLRELNARRALLAGLPLALMCWLRPEAPVYVAIAAFSLLLWAKLPPLERLKNAIFFCVPGVLFFLAQLAFRLPYYGELVPNTVLAKVAFSPQRLVYGFQYTSKAFAVFLPLILYGFLTLSAAKKATPLLPAYRFGGFCLSVVLLSFAALLIGGGDVFQGFRPIVPLLPLMLLALMMGLSSISRFGRFEAVFLLAIIGYYGYSQFAVDINQTRISRAEKSGRIIGEYLKERYGKTQPLIAVYTAGAVPYYSGLPSLDVYGLNNRDLTHARKTSAHFGMGAPGHDLFDAAYIESKKPDILVFDAIPNVPLICDAPAYTKECHEILLPNYREEVVERPGMRFILWLRKDSDKLD